MHEATLTNEWIGFVCLAIFVAGYYFIAAEEKYHINKSKPALFIGTFMFILIGLYTLSVGGDTEGLHNEVKHIVEEIAEIFFFLFVAMTYIETLINRSVFDTLKYVLVSKGYGYRKLFWLTGLLAFFISPVADNLTTALILSTVLLTIDRTRKEFLVPGAINIVVAANAGGAWSPFGDITTLMAWQAGKAPFIDFFFVFPSSISGWFLTAFLLSRFVPDEKPAFDPTTEPAVHMKRGARIVIGLGIFTIFSAVMCENLFNIPPVWGMMFGLSLLMMFSYYQKRATPHESFNVYESVRHIEADTLLFFFGILAAVGALHYVGYLGMVAHAYEIIGPTAANICVGLISAVVDNVPVMSAILKANPNMGVDQWLFIALTAGIGGSLISFGSAAGVGVMGKLRGTYTFMAHMRLAWTVLVGYILSVIIWYIQFEILGWYILTGGNH
ncbi:MAG: sodium:proton antiporter NhaD [Helicobacteraceae bacterium]|jgi:Na+/H+ antiporter NhaD/arsenite permease-like protein|nr:sodium:proton antiporter NhaD [Helicobacteraceae bacterium]